MTRQTKLVVSRTVRRKEKKISFVLVQQDSNSMLMERHATRVSNLPQDKYFAVVFDTMAALPQPKNISIIVAWLKNSSFGLVFKNVT